MSRKSKTTERYKFRSEKQNWDDIEAVEPFDIDNSGIDVNGDRNVYKIKEIDLHDIGPQTVNSDGTKINVVSKPGTGKTVLLGSILYFKRHIIPCGQIFSGTEDSTGVYAKHMPSLFIYNKISTDDIERFVKRQKLAMKYLDNPWAFTLWDDISDNKKFLRSELVQKVYKNGRNWKMLLLNSSQYALDCLPVIRTCIDVSFLGRETSERNRKVLWTNYAAAIPNMPAFHAVMDEITEDKTFLCINNKIDSNRPEDCLGYYKAPMDRIPPNWKFGSESFWKFSKTRLDDTAAEEIDT